MFSLQCVMLLSYTRFLLNFSSGALHQPKREGYETGCYRIKCLIFLHSNNLYPPPCMYVLHKVKVF